jgi:hypothetical protein
VDRSGLAIVSTTSATRSTCSAVGTSGDPTATRAVALRLRPHRVHADPARGARAEREAVASISYTPDPRSASPTCGASATPAARA